MVAKVHKYTTNLFVITDLFINFITGIFLYEKKMVYIKLRLTLYKDITVEPQVRHSYKIP